MTANNSNNPVIIFHRSKQGSEEDLINQQAFLELHKDTLGSVKVLTYTTGDHRTALDIIDIVRMSSKKPTIIFNSPFTTKEHDLQYDLYCFFEVLKAMGLSSIYLMDSAGKLYKEAETIELL